MSYSLYNFTLVKNGGFYVLTFSSPSNSAVLSVPSLVYLNVGNTCFSLDRFSPLLVNLMDGQGLVTVDYTRCTSFASVSGANFVSQVLAL